LSNNKKEIRDELIDYILKITNKDKQEKVLNKLNEVNAKDENYDSKLENLEDILIQIFTRNKTKQMVKIVDDIMDKYYEYPPEKRKAIEEAFRDIISLCQEDF
jgi:endonuclease III